jgi:AmmeMemoRadiSam system protein A
MNAIQRNILLETAKAAVISAVARKQTARPATDDPSLLEYRGCFVTLKNHGDLRGCIGQFTADRPLIEMVWQMAIASAARDPRFLDRPLTPRELTELDIEISVLSPMEKTDDPLSLELGRHGIYITAGRRSGCFLPQVATETGWSKEEFLDFCCTHKAGLRPGAWRDDPNVTVYLFTAEVFGAAWTQIEGPSVL